jgi:hypothetical protein
MNAVPSRAACTASFAPEIATPTWPSVERGLCIAAAPVSVVDAALATLCAALRICSVRVPMVFLPFLTGSNPYS